MRWNDWNILEFSLFVSNTYLSPALCAWGIVDVYHQILLHLSNLLVSVFPSLLLKYTSVAALVMAIKFILLIALLVFIRGGIPRYRYDFLTKIGWIKFLSLVLAVFLSSLLLVMLF
jgi:NADH:ubiquinone oxidoreductase subunit H